MKFMSSEETLDTIEGRDSFNTREAWLSQRCRANDEVIIESLQRWHILSPKVGRLSSRKTAQYSVPFIPWSSYSNPRACAPRVNTRQVEESF